MRQDSETNIIVLNTALKYKIQRITPKNTNILNKKNKYIEYTKYKHILKNQWYYCLRMNVMVLYRSKFQRVTNAAGDTVAEPGHTTKPSHRMFLRHVSPLVPRAGSWDCRGVYQRLRFSGSRHRPLRCHWEQRFVGSRIQR